MKVRLLFRIVRVRMRIEDGERRVISKQPSVLFFLLCMEKMIFSTSLIALLKSRVSARSFFLLVIRNFLALSITP